MKNIKYLFLLVIFTIILSCTTDDKMNVSDKLIGEWLRNDFNEHLEFKLIFQSDNIGFRFFREGSMETGIVSSAVQFNWSIDENILTFDELDETITTTFLINSKGQLLLKGYSDLPFIRVE